MTNRYYSGPFGQPSPNEPRVPMSNEAWRGYGSSSSSATSATSPFSAFAFSSQSNGTYSSSAQPTRRRRNPWIRLPDEMQFSAYIQNILRKNPTIPLSAEEINELEAQARYKRDQIELLQELVQPLYQRLNIENERRGYPGRWP